MLDIPLKSKEDTFIIIKEDFDANFSEGVAALAHTDDGLQFPYVHWCRLDVVDWLEIHVKISKRVLRGRKETVKIHPTVSDKDSARIYHERCDAGP